MTQKVKPFILIEGKHITRDEVNLDGETVNTVCLVTEPQYVTERGQQKSVIALLDVLRNRLVDFYGQKHITFVYYVTTEPKTLLECQENLVGITMGMPKADWYHRYSDLTGYLWTTVEFEAKDDAGRAHDINEELSTSINDIELAGKRAYLTLEIRAH